MSLTSGARLGSYQIVSPLGAGGMGEVYRARDTKLGRDVALKILPDAVANDPDRLMRFEREAKTLAALNHPHVAQVYGIEEGPLSDSADGRRSSRAIVMELVDGEDLATRLARGPIPVDEAIGIAAQIADGLQAAHERGIIHRDLKPANVKVRPDATVKVLDFGLAKGLPAAAPGTADVVDSPTITSPALTMSGVILGTAAYMSPEQAKGKAVDKRADVWAFGCVLYEMLTGKRAFDGEDVSDTLALVLKGEPDWAALPADTPAAIRTVLRRCVERDWRRRVPDMSVVRFVLEEARDLTESSGTEARPLEASRSRVLPAIVTVTLLAAVAALGIWLLRSPAAPPPVTRFSIHMSGALLTFIRPSFAVSPDGTQLVFINEGRLFLQRFSEFEPREIAAADIGQNINTPVFSPDGAWIAFHSGSKSTVMRVSVHGGAAFTVCEAPPPLEMSWGAAGILIGQGPLGVTRCAPTGGSDRVVAVSDGEVALSPQFLPEANGVLFTLAKAVDGGRRFDNAVVVVQSLGDGARKTVLAGGSFARYLPTGHLVYLVGGVAFAIPFAIDRLETVGEPRPIIEGVRRFPTGAAQLSISDAGVMAFMPGPAGSSSNERVLALGTREGTLTKLAAPPAEYSEVRASPDGTRLVVTTDNGRDSAVFVYRIAGGALQRLTIGGNNRFAIWSPDGRYVAFQSDRGGDLGIYHQRVDGSDPAERLTTAAEGESHMPESWSPDGRHLAFAVNNGATYTLQVLSLADKRVSPFAGVQSDEPTNAVFSRDGKWLAYSIGIAGGLAAPNRGVYVQPFPATGAVYQAPRQILDFHPLWSPRGDELLFVASATSGLTAAVPVTIAESVTFGAPARFPSTVTSARLSSERRAHDILPDGRFVGLAAVGEVDMPQATGLEIRVALNWFQELERLAPRP
jgi:serine/threonine-protein kinase